MNNRVIVCILAAGAATSVLVGCATRFVGAYPMEGARCTEVHITREGGHYAGEYIVGFNEVRADEVHALRNACPDDPGTPADEAGSSCIVATVPDGATTGPLTIRQDAGAGAFIGMLSSDTFDLGTFRVAEPPIGPCNSWDHAPAGDVPPAACPATASAAVGARAQNFSLMDQFADEVELCQFYGQVVILVFFTDWCGPCVEHMRELETEYWQEHRDEGLVVIGILEEGLDHSLVTPEYVAMWAERYGVTYPLLGDFDQAVYRHYFGSHISPPKMVIIDREMRIRSIDSCLPLMGGCNTELALGLL